MKRDLTMTLAIATLAAAAMEESMTPQEREAAEERQRLKNEAYRRQKQAENDAIAAPYREARRLRKAALRAKGHGT